MTCKPSSHCLCHNKRGGNCPHLPYLLPGNSLFVFQSSLASKSSKRLTRYCHYPGKLAHFLSQESALLLDHGPSEPLPLWHACLFSTASAIMNETLASHLSMSWLNASEIAPFWGKNVIRKTSPGWPFRDQEQPRNWLQWSGPFENTLWPQKSISPRCYDALKLCMVNFYI